MNNEFQKRLRRQISDKLDFAKGVVSQPKTVGAIVPTSQRMAEIMANVINPDSGLPVIELGPGTGVITNAILDKGIAQEDLYSIEYAEEFLPGLKKRFPKVNFIHGDAFNLSHLVENLGIEKCDCIISALPLLNFPVTQRIRLVNAALGFVEVGRPFVQFSYGPRPPVPERLRHFSVEHIDTVIRNIPPAKVWAYRRKPEEMMQNSVTPDNSGGD